MTNPQISVLMANHNGAAFLREAVTSVLGQSMSALELIVVDDASTDDSVTILREMAAADTRLRLIEAPSSGGPAAARNLALDAAQGAWVAVVDSDDILLPRRFAQMLAASGPGVDAIADDLAYFGDPELKGTTLMAGYAQPNPWPLTAEGFLKAHLARFDLPPLGYLKPMFRREALDDLRYDESLRIGEDSDLVLRFLLTGHRMLLMPDALYRYRRHAGSISHRLSPGALRAMIDKAGAMTPDMPADLQPLMVERVTEMERGLAFETLVADLKARRIGPALGSMAARPALMGRLAGAVGQGLRRRVSGA